MKTSDCNQDAMAGFSAAHGSARLLSQRQIKLSELRAKWAIKQQQATQIAHAIDALADSNMTDEAAIDVAEKILNANIGP
jgi:SOS response regulatory protein OraA/RecX